MSLDTSKRFLQFQIIDLTTVSGGGGGTTDHAALSNLDFASSNHTGFLAQNGSTSLTGVWNYGAFTISGTGDIYCNDLYTAGSTIYIGDDVEISAPSGDLVMKLAPSRQLEIRDSGDTQKFGFNYDGTFTLANTSEATIRASLSDGNLNIKAPPRTKSGGYLRFRKSDDTDMGYFNSSNLEFNLYGDIYMAGSTPMLRGSAYDSLYLRTGTRASGDYRIYFQNNQAENIVSIDAEGNLVLSGWASGGGRLTCSDAGYMGWGDVYFARYTSSEISVNADLFMVGTTPRIRGSSGENLQLLAVTSKGAGGGVEVVLGENAGIAKFSVQDNGYNEVAYIDSNGNALFGGNLTVSGTGDFGDTITAGGSTPEIQFSATSGTIGVSGNTDLIQLTGSDVTVDGDIYCDNFYTSSVRAGRDTVASGVDNHTVAFVYNFVNTDYTVSVNLANTVDTPPSLYSSIITSTTVSGFSVLFSGDIDSSNYVLHYAVAHD